MIINNRDWLILSDVPGKRGIWIPQGAELSLEAEADIWIASVTAYKEYSGSEISGLGRLLPGKSVHDFFIPEIIIPRQIGRIIETTITGEIIEAAFQELESQGKNPLEYNVWWHSHGSMSVWFSGTDRTMIRERLRVMLTTVHAHYLAEGEEIPSEVLAGPFFSIVANIRGEMSMRCDVLYRVNEEHRFFAFEESPLIRHLFDLPKNERNKLVAARLPRIRTLVLERLVRFKEEEDSLLEKLEKSRRRT